MYLLDTHIIVWYIENNVRLKKSTREIIENDSIEIYVSKISFWELAIKQANKKIDFVIMPEALELLLIKNKFKIVELETKHIHNLISLPFFHRDPFDRMLIAQSISNNLILISDDEQFIKYPIKLLK